MSPPRIFDRQTYAQRRSRAESSNAESFLVEQAATTLIERFHAITRRFRRGLDLGSRRQSFAQLAPLADRWVCSALATTNAAADVVADEEFLPFAPASFDLITSVLSLHAVNDLPGALIQIRKTLAPGGLFMAALFGGATLNELRRAFAQGESETTGGISPRVAPFADVRDLGGLLQRAGFSLPVADVERQTVRYREFFTLARDLREVGETNVLAARAVKPLRRDTLANVLANYTRNDAAPDGRLNATFDVVYLTGWADG